MHTYLGNSLTLSYLASFVAALLLSMLFTFVMMKALPMLGIVDKPDARKIHKKPMPRMGGPAIYVAFVIPMLLLYYFDTPQKGIIIGGGIVLAVGVVDDIFGVRATVKLLVLFLLTLLLKRYGLAANLPFERIGIDREIGNTVVSLLWIVGITSAMNALDHMDGLAGGVSLVACLSYLAVSLQTSNFFWGLLSVCLAGSLSGFLCFNWHPARIFMGDSGSFFLGFTLAAVGLMGGWSENPVKAATIPILILSLPIFDLGYVILSRWMNGTTKTVFEAITYCGKDHIGHRMMTTGLGQAKAAALVCLFSATVSISALTIRRVDAFGVFLLLLQISCMYMLLLSIMRGSRSARGI
jgi:UDP-GlcNAc:undecaprenyl-phosphate GlcNAc-1-phosphate transferase